MKRFLLRLQGIVYRLILKPIFFMFDAEKIHDLMTIVGANLGEFGLIKAIFRLFFVPNNPEISQEFFGMNFKSPIGLAAGFDYEARLTQILPTLGFGFGVVGTITNLPYEGNAIPRLGRLPKSLSLFVNKGFKNKGIKYIVERLSNKKFEVPIGISIGKTNSKKEMTQSESVADIVEAFKIVENSGVDFSFYELNISCPNLHGNVEFFSIPHLKGLLTAVSGLNLSKPLFVKMPIEKSNEEVLEMLKLASEFPVKGVVFGNLQKDRNDESFDKEEIKKAGKGHFSGKPMERRSNELIKIAYKNFGKRFLIIGCGGIFTAEDAYKKIRLGSSLLQLITGMIYQGPQLIAEINHDLFILLKKDGFSNISQAIGVDAFK